MYNMLIVDNEKIIVDGLTEYFSELRSLDLEVHSTYSGREAIRLLEEIKFDVVLTDIQMPGMSGLELQQEVITRWPRCKVIFLTGYDEFDYAYQAIRNGASNYILKTEGYEAIQEAVSKVLSELNESLNLDLLLTSARRQQQASLPLLQKEFVQGILLGDPVSHRNRERQLKELEINLADEEQVLLLIGRIDEWRDASTPSDKALIAYAIQNISAEFLQQSIRFHSFAHESSRIIWIIQALPSSDPTSVESLQKRAMRFVQFTLQDIQSAFKEFLKIPVSFAMGQAFVNWHSLPDQFESLKLLLHFGLGTGVETIMLDSRSVKPESDDLETSMPESSVTTKIRQMHSSMENGDRSEFFVHLGSMINSASLQMPHKKTERLEFFMSLAGMLLSFINRWNLYQEIGSTVNIDVLAKWDANMVWSEYTDVFCRIAEALFHARTKHSVDQEREIVTKIQDYVKAHLADDISLTKIGEEFGHHPYYLSRLYKQISNQGLSDYLAEARLNKAKELLQYSELKIREISEAVGFISEKYFYRFFKKSVGVTPQNYRDQSK